MNESMAEYQQGSGHADFHGRQFAWLDFPADARSHHRSGPYSRWCCAVEPESGCTSASLWETGEILRLRGAFPGTSKV